MSTGDTPPVEYVTRAEHMEATSQLAQHMNGLAAKLTTLEGGQPAGGWRGYFFGALTSRRFQLTVVAIAGVIVKGLNPDLYPTEVMWGILGIISAYIAGESATDMVRANAEAKKTEAITKAQANIAIMRPQGGGEYQGHVPPIR